MGDLLNIGIEGGKYTLIQREDGGGEILRNNEPWMSPLCNVNGSKMILAMGYELDGLRSEVGYLKGWKDQMIAIQEAADKKLRPLLEDVAGSLGRHVYEVAADEIIRLRAEVERMRYGLDYIGGTPCACAENGAMVYQHPKEALAVCVGCLAKAYAVRHSG